MFYTLRLSISPRHSKSGNRDSQNYIEGCEDRVECAYHEAGHAVALFLNGAAETELMRVSMRANSKSVASIRRRHSPYTGVLSSVPNFSLSGNKLWRNAAIWEGIVWLAGPAAAWRYNGTNREHWFRRLCDEDEELGDDDDLNQPLAFARKVVRTEQQAIQLLATMARYTEELLAEPAVWKVVVALATSLDFGKIMSGKTACKIMRGAWGRPDAYPMLSLGRKWKRRVSFRSNRNLGLLSFLQPPLLHNSVHAFGNGHTASTHLDRGK